MQIKITQESLTINRQDKTENHVPRICLPQGDLPTVHSRYTRRRGPIEGFPSLSPRAGSGAVRIDPLRFVLPDVVKGD